MDGRSKINSNKERDVRNKMDLKKLGWKVIEVWQCEINSKVKREEKFNHLVNKIIEDV
jgi:DNA mismatch endonuclease (patch repair protein)